MTCKTCLHWDARLDKRGRRIVRDNHYRCKAPLPDLPALPACIRVVDGRSFGCGGELVWPPHRASTPGDHGEGCPFWTALPAQTQA
jgi:hypothetical protein